jgi:tRNA G18 (ribose-2'-O)-methylase SpoU
VNPIDEYRDIADGVLMRERGLFVAEGRVVVRRVIEDSRYAVRSVLLNDAAHRDLGDVLKRLPDGTPVYVQPRPAFQEITGVDFHRGCLALVHRPADRSVESVVGLGSPLVMLEDVTNADNVGGVFRNAAAFGAGAIVLSPTCCDPLYRKAIRTSVGTVLRVPFARADDWTAALACVRAHGFLVAALTPREPAETLEAFADRARGARVALVIGSESSGVSETVRAVADARVRIPMVEGVDSLNLAVAAGIALHAVRSRDERRSPRGGAGRPMSPDRRTGTSGRR